MKPYKHCCVIGNDNKFNDFVLVRINKNEKTGELVETIENYIMGDGQRLIESNPPTMKVNADIDGFINPVWSDKKNSWVETATKEEIDIWNAEHPVPVFALSQLDRIETIIQQNYAEAHQEGADAVMLELLRRGII